MEWEVFDTRWYYLKLSMSMRSLLTSTGGLGLDRRAEADRCACLEWLSPTDISAVAAASSSPTELRYVPPGVVGELTLSLALNTVLDKVESR